MDAFAVSVSSGVSIKGLRFSQALRASFFFGFLQFIMPLAGRYIGAAFITYIEAYDHWLAFVLLALIGGKMIWEGLKGKDGQKSGDRDKGADIRRLGSLLVLSLATSIDALAVGVSFSILKWEIWESAGIIGGITFLVCLAGFEFGKRIGMLFERGAQIAGGLILAGIGLKILIEHLF
ncbi:MAG: manganese efflux pump MntP family protein [Treponema sp.]|nr:manganese efflux pump MntP family protein [Treponema sp.]